MEEAKITQEDLDDFTDWIKTEHPEVDVPGLGSLDILLDET